MANISGIAVTIKAFLPTGKTLDEQFAALTLVKEAHASGDYSKVLSAAKIDDVKAEQKTRRVEDAPSTTTTTTTAEVDNGGETTGAETANDGDEMAGEPGEAQGEAGDDDKAVPGFLRKSRSRAA